MWNSPASCADDSFEDNGEMDDWQYCFRYFHLVPASNKKIICIDPKFPHYLYSPNCQCKMLCVTAEQFLQEKAPKSLFKTTELHHCEITPIRGSLADHSHNPMDNEDHDNSGGPTPEEIGMLYFKWAMCIKCAEATTETPFLQGVRPLRR
jgi:hypothetical protein